MRVQSKSYIKSAIDCSFECVKIGIGSHICCCIVELALLVLLGEGFRCFVWFGVCVKHCEFAMDIRVDR